EPYATPTYPAIVANLMTCLLMGTTVLFAWPTWCAILSGSLMVAGCAVVAAILTSRGLPTAPFGLAIGSLVAGVVTVAASARVMDRFRASLAQRQDELAAFSTRLMSVHEEERRRVARELHEELGSSLTAILSYLWLFDRHRPEDVETLQSRAADARRIVTKPKNGDAGTGLIGIRERVRALGGSVALTSGSGAHLRVRLPAAGKRAMRA